VFKHGIIVQENIVSPFYFRHIQKTDYDNIYKYLNEDKKNF